MVKDREDLVSYYSDEASEMIMVDGCRRSLRSFSVFWDLAVLIIETFRKTVVPRVRI
jgi:hypothetical protein